MASPPPAVRPSAGAFFSNLFKLRRQRSAGEFREGSSRSGHRSQDSEYSVGRDSSTHSALFDLELSQRGDRSQRSGGGGDWSHRSSGDRSRRGDRSFRGDRSLRGGDRSGRGHRFDAADAMLQATLQRVLYLSRPTARFEVELLQDVAALRESCTSPDGSVDLPQLAEDLIKMGYNCRLQINDPTDPAQRPTSAAGLDKGCLEKLRHSFIVCEGRVENSWCETTHKKQQQQQEYYCLVDPRFRDQFKIGQPTTSYEALLRAVPLEFVGSPVRLQALAGMLCAEIVAAYKQQSLPLPPWRKPTAMLSRWFEVHGGGASGTNMNNTSTANVSASASGGGGADSQFTATSSINAPETNDLKSKQQQQQQQQQQQYSGGSSQFFSMLAMHQESLERQRQHRNAATSTTINAAGGATASPSAAATDSIVHEQKEERSNKPRRQLLMQQQQQDASFVAHTSHHSPQGSTDLSLGGTYTRSASFSRLHSDLATIQEGASPSAAASLQASKAGSSAASSSTGHSQHGLAASMSAVSLTNENENAGTSVRQQKQQKKNVSLLARGLKSVGHKQIWNNILPAIHNVRKIGSKTDLTAAGSDNSGGGGKAWHHSHKHSQHHHHR